MALQAIGGQGSKLPVPAPAPSPTYTPLPAPTSTGALGRAGVGVGGATNTDTFYGPSPTNAVPSTPGYQVAPPTPPVAPAPPPGPSGPQTGPGSPFDSDPGYQAALAAEHLGIGSADSALNNLIQQRIIAYGDPALANMAGFGLDPQAAAFARQNYLSGNAQLARIDKQHQNNLRAIINQLAGHGLVFSGDTGYQTGQEDQGYGNNVYDAQQAALADILGYRQNTTQQEQALHSQTIQALEQAYQNYINNPSAYGNDQGYQGTLGSFEPDVAGNYQYATAAQVANALKRYNTAQNKNLGF